MRDNSIFADGNNLFQRNSLPICRPYCCAKVGERKADATSTLSIPSVVQKRFPAKGRSIDTHTTDGLGVFERVLLPARLAADGMSIEPPCPALMFEHDDDAVGEELQRSGEK